MNTYKIIGIVLLVFCASLLFIFKLENDIVDFITGLLTALGLSLTFGLLPKKKEKNQLDS
ncbi:hypothetical protein [Polaribacter sp. IC073]|uniref:hypothetical protein n=1 Tax=Polaribacter sp. IC073 TaxID=2508540 RepID=UPI0011BF909A|nr:hypothetical protein [Polaribacter sp. IC073]TXD49652.1 hypothetical protein ES045_00250 [Polaribacter sp. IC073]